MFKFYNSLLISCIDIIWMCTKFQLNRLVRSESNFDYTILPRQATKLNNKHVKFQKQDPIWMS